MSPTFEPHFRFYLFYKLLKPYSVTLGGENLESMILSAPTTRGDKIELTVNDGVLVEEVKEEWKRLWRSRVDDKVRAEGVADKAFSLLFVDRGTVIVATRDFRPLDLKEILDQHNFENVARLVEPHHSVGGWAKFARSVLNNQERYARSQLQPSCRSERSKDLQPKKGGRGWLHIQ